MKNECTRCKGAGTVYDEVRWSDGLGGVDATCPRCRGTGIEPDVDDLNRKLDKANERVIMLRHAVFTMTRSLMWAWDGKSLGVDIVTGWNQLPKSDQKLLTDQTGVKVKWTGYVSRVVRVKEMDDR